MKQSNNRKYTLFQVLREDLCSVLADLDKKDDSTLEEAARLVRMARNDYKVWKGGLVQTQNRIILYSKIRHIQCRQVRFSLTYMSIARNCGRGIGFKENFMGVEG